MAHSLGILTIAEGIETNSQKKFLEPIGCHAIQGNLVRKPIPFEKALNYQLQNKNYYLE